MHIFIQFLINLSNFLTLAANMKAPCSTVVLIYNRYPLNLLLLPLTPTAKPVSVPRPPDDAHNVTSARRSVGSWCGSPLASPLATAATLRRPDEHGGGGRTRIQCILQMYNSKCFRSLRCMLQALHIDVAKVDQDAAHVVMAIHVCFKCISQMFHLF